MSDSLSIPSPVHLSPLSFCNHASPCASPIRAPEVDTSFYDKVMNVLTEYILIITERLSREGNYSHYFENEIEDEINWFEPILIQEYHICIETFLRKHLEHIEYIISISIQLPHTHYPIKEVVFWRHREEHTDIMFDAHFIPYDTIDLFRPKIRRFNNYLPFRACAANECTMLLTEQERQYCFECSSCISTCPCSICLDEHTPKIVLTTSCGHSFHKECFLQIIPIRRHRVKCPMCRTIVHYQTGK